MLIIYKLFLVVIIFHFYLKYPIFEFHVKKHGMGIRSCDLHSLLGRLWRRCLGDAWTTRVVICGIVRSRD